MAILMFRNFHSRLRNEKQFERLGALRTQSVLSRRFFQGTHWHGGLQAARVVNGLYFAHEGVRDRETPVRSHASPDATRASSRAAIAVADSVAGAGKNVELKDLA